MTRRFNGPARVPDLMLERYRLGELTPDEIAAFERRLSGDDDLRQRLQALETSDVELQRDFPPAVLAAQVRRRLEARTADATPIASARFFGLRWTAVAALAGVLLLVVLVGPPLVGPSEDSADRIKGLEPTLVLFRKVPQGSEPLQEGALARAGNLIRIGYRAAGSTWGLILSVDGRGVVTLHLPREGTRAVRLSTESQVLLDFAYELDDAPRWERFYLVTGSVPFDAAPVIDAAKRAAMSGGAAPPALLPLGKDVKQSSVLLIK